MTAGGLRAHGRLRRLGLVAAAAMVGVGLVSCGSSSTSSGSTSGASGGAVTLEFAQWWGAELPDGSFDKIIADFDGARTRPSRSSCSARRTRRPSSNWSPARRRKTLPDVVGLDGAWVNDFAKQGAIADLSALMTDGELRRRVSWPARSRSRRQDVHDPGGQLRLPAVRQPGSADQGRGRRGAHDPHRVPGRGQEDQRALAATSRAGPFRSTPPSPTASRTTSCPGCGRPAAPCSRTASPTCTNDAGQERRRLHQEPQRRRRHRARLR